MRSGPRRLAIATRGERLVTVLGDEQAPETDRLRKATNRFVRHLKEELTAWEDKYMRARGKQWGDWSPPRLRQGR